MKKRKTLIALITLLTIVFLVLLFISNSFLKWVFERHQNQLSWFIRPLFMIPFCYYAYQRSCPGIAVTMFCLFTGMCWFNKPELVSEEVKAFLQFEVNWITNKRSSKEVLSASIVPVAFVVLGLACWKRSLWMGLGVVALIAFGKIIWSIQNTGQSGKAVVLPAISGLIICCVLIYFGFKRLQKTRTTRLHGECVVLK